jgi:O-succinylhomoserine sulfhydrylase
MLAKRQMTDFGTVVSFELDGGLQGRASRFAEALEFFSIAASLGSTESLVVPPALLGGSGIHPRATGRVADRPGHRAPVDRDRGCGRI